jgi:hypothetical protein
VRAHLAMRAGGLNVAAADALMEGDFSFNVADWKPKVNYEVNDAYRDSDVTLEVDVEGVVGEINLEVV